MKDTNRNKNLKMADTKDVIVESVNQPTLDVWTFGEIFFIV